MSWFPSFWSSPKTFKSSSDVPLTINGQLHSVPADLPADTRLIDYLRDHQHLTGPKFTCREGACGSCVVCAERFNPVFKKTEFVSIPGCLVPLYACAGYKITTIEGIGERNNGYHPLQKRLADYNGSQCGFCSPGMVMTMYSFLKKEKFPEVQDVEDLFDGNLCRCTGFRPILDAAKSFAEENKGTTLNDVNSSCVKRPGVLEHPCPLNQLIHLQLDEAEWFRPSTLNELYDILNNLNDGKKIRLVVGNTSEGVYPDDGPFDAYIDTKGIQEFYTYKLSETECVIGANVSLTDLIKIFGKTLLKMNGFEYSGVIARHIKQVANTNVRNIGCWAGNLMMKRHHPEFPSDIFTILEGAGAKVTIGHYDGSEETVSPLKLINLNKNDWVIIDLRLSVYTSNQHFNSFKIMPRSQNAQAYVNAAFLFETEGKNWKVKSKPSIVYAGISSNFTHAQKTEFYLTGKELNDPAVLRESINILSEEIIPDSDRILGSAKYRKQLAVHLFYKCLLGIVSEDVSDKLKSGADILSRPISSGTQTFDSNWFDWPLNKPITKMEALAQCSGEAEYIMDIPKPPDTLYATFVLSTVGKASIQNLDPSEALKLPGVIRCLTAKDIPGENNVFADPLYLGATTVPEELFSSGHIRYAGQPVALIIAESPSLAKKAAKLVKVTYKDQIHPVVSLEEAIKNLPPPIHEDTEAEVHEGDAETALKTAPHVVKGEVRTGSQFHIHMETQVTLCIPIEDGMDVFTSTQWMESSHQSVAQVLGVKKSSLNLQVKRLGGAFGGKATRNIYIGTACALAAHLTNRPVFFQLDLSTNMEAIGKRHNILAKYEVGFDNDGKLLAVKILYYLDSGCYPNEAIVQWVTGAAKNVYDCPNWSLIPRTVITNLPANTWMRAVGEVEGVFVTEVILEHVAKQLNKNPWDVKFLNMKSSVSRDGEIFGSSIKDIWSQLMKEAEIEQRFQGIQEYNKNNTWKKKGLSIVPMEYKIEYDDGIFNALVSVYKNGGSVAVTHGGVEMGQGINTKVAQVCAYELGIPMDYISVKSTNTLTNPRAYPSGSSITSELNCKAVAECCQILKKRMQPFWEQTDGPPVWEEIVQKCFIHQIDLCARHMYGPAEKPKGYSVYGVTAAEVTVDVLTGQYQIERVDIIFDCGQSLNPKLDIGQIEGAFVMGLGYFLSEEVKHDSTGKLLTNRLWEYFPPTSKDVPIDFRITLLKNAPNPSGVLKSKTAGEPPLCMSCSALFSIQSAIHAARADNGDLHWYPLNSPATVESVHLACDVKNDRLVFKQD